MIYRPLIAACKHLRLEITDLLIRRRANKTGIWLRRPWTIPWRSGSGERGRWCVGCVVGQIVADMDHGCRLPIAWWVPSNAVGCGGLKTSIPFQLARCWWARQSISVLRTWSILCRFMCCIFYFYCIFYWGLFLWFRVLCWCMSI